MSTQLQIAAERRLSADLLESLDEVQLATASLCDGWSVREVFGHELMPLVTPLPKVVLGLVKARGNFDRVNLEFSQTVARTPVPEMAALLRQHATNAFHAPGFPLESALLDLLVHGQDIRRPLGLTRAFDPDAQRKALDMLAARKAERAFVRKGRLAGLSWHAVDVEWRFGSGPEVSGPAEALMLAIAGRSVALADLSGDGLERLRSR